MDLTEQELWFEILKVCVLFSFFFPYYKCDSWLGMKTKINTIKRGALGLLAEMLGQKKSEGDL